MNGVTSRSVLAIDPNSCDDGSAYGGLSGDLYTVQQLVTPARCWQIKKKEKKKKMTSKATAVTVAGSVRHTQAGVLSDVSDS